MKGIDRRVKGGWAAASALLITAALGAAVSPAPRAEEPAAASRAAAAIRWTDVQGRVYGADDLAKAKATVFFFSSTQCPVSNRYTPRMIALARDYTRRGVRFVLVNANAEDSAAAVARYAHNRKIPFPAVKDDNTALADRLGANITPEAVIVDAAGTVRYRGRIDDNRDAKMVTRHDVREALDALLAGKPVARTRTLSFGCTIFREKPAPVSPAAVATKITYARDVAPILNANCVSCHRAGDVAPFALENYQQARTYAQPIKEYTARRLMPPWKPVPGHGAFHDARRLSDAQIATLARWADSGAAQGDPKQTPPTPRFAAARGWTLGTPDRVLQPARAYRLAAEGKDVYRNFVLPADFEEDKWVAAWDFRPSNRAVVHHIIAYIDPTGESAKRDGQEDGEPGYSVSGGGAGIRNAQWGDGWAPGSTPRRLQPGVATRIPKGAKLVLQVHYHKTGKVEEDRSQVALYFAKGKVSDPLYVAPVGNASFELKPGVAYQEVRASLVTPANVKVHAVFPHMHMLGREMKVTATLPDGTQVPMIWIRDWDFAWQTNYHYTKPQSFPKGTKVDVVAVYDNSEKNPRQPSHPPQTVRFGEQTTDEMCFAFISFTVDKSAASSSGTAASLPAAPKATL